MTEKVRCGPVAGPGRRVELTGPREAARGALPALGPAKGSEEGARAEDAVELTETLSDVLLSRAELVLWVLRGMV